MNDTSFTKFSKKLPPVKTGQRFGGKVNQTKKVGLFSERRFLIFTKKGPIEIHFKPIHYTTAFLSLMVGFTCIVYWSAIGIYSAFDVAQNDLITEASANFSQDKEIINNQVILNKFDLENKFNLNDFVEKYDDKLESNISIPPIGEMNKGKNIKGPSVLSTEPFNIFEQEKRFTTGKLASKNIDTTDFDDEIKSYTINESNINNLTEIIKKKEEDPIASFLPPRQSERAENYRFIASLENELESMEKVLNSLDIKIVHNKLIALSNLEKIAPNTNPESLEYLKSLKKRLDILSIYKNAIQFIPLKPPMEHYYVSSAYGKRKHPVTKKWRFHHGIDLAGTWQENVTVSADGVVVFAGYHGSFGKVIRIKHNHGIKTTYGHLAKIKVRKGEIVTEGQVIGKMGKTGRVKGAHLHYEISVNGKSKNPAKFFAIGKKLLSRSSIKTVSRIN